MILLSKETTAGNGGKDVTIHSKTERENWPYNIFFIDRYPTGQTHSLDSIKHHRGFFVPWNLRSCRVTGAQATASDDNFLLYGWWLRWNRYQNLLKHKFFVLIQQKWEKTKQHQWKSLYNTMNMLMQHVQIIRYRTVSCKMSWNWHSLKEYWYSMQEFQHITHKWWYNLYQN